MLSFFKSAFAKIGSAVGTALGALGDKPEKEALEQLEETLLEADLGPTATTELLSQLKDQNLSRKTPAQVLAEKLETLLDGIEGRPSLAETGVTSFLILGVNGAGKTTTVAKLAHFFKTQGKQVLIASADTFRAAANDQLEAWAARAGVPLIQSRLGADPAAVAFDGLTAAKARGVDILLIDTAGRLTTKETLMAELGKIEKALKKVEAGAPTHRWLVLDGSLGLNSLSQAKAFTQVVPLTGLIVTKLDGSPKGGFLVPLFKELHLPVYFVGLGEGLDDLKPFSKKDYIDALLSYDISQTANDGKHR